MEPAGKRVAQNERNKVSAEDSQQRSESRAEQTLQSCLANLDFEENDGHANQNARRRTVRSGEIEGTQVPGGC